MKFFKKYKSHFLTILFQSIFFGTVCGCLTIAFNPFYKSFLFGFFFVHILFIVVEIIVFFDEKESLNKKEKNLRVIVLEEL